MHKSHPTGVRGLKREVCKRVIDLCVSHPTGVRGLKHGQAAFRGHAGCVAPHRGAWIETIGGQALKPSTLVAPHRGAWIETPELKCPDARTNCRTPQGCVD